MKPLAAVIEVSSPQKKTIRVVAQSRREVETTLLILPELKGDKATASKLAFVV